MKRIMCSMVLAGALLTGFAQTNPVPRRPNVAVGVNHRAADSARVSSVNVGLSATTDSLRGVQVGLLSSVVTQDMRGLNAGTMFALSIGNARGVQMSSLVNATGQHMQGLQMATLSNVAHSLRGIQLAGMSNISRSAMHGMQLTGISNISMGVDVGTQLSGVANICSQEMHGVQVGTYNYADTVHGLQLGLVNVCMANPRGAQVGLVNYSRDAHHHRYGLVNLHPDTRIDLMAFGGTSSKMNVALRVQNEGTYSMVGVGTHYRGLNKRFSGALFYRLGQRFDVSPRWHVGGDVGFHHIETFEDNADRAPKRLYSLQPRLTTDIDLTATLGVHAAAGYEFTRHYGGGSYRRGWLLEAGLSYRLPPLGSALAVNRRVRHAYSDTLMLGRGVDCHPWIAAAEVVGINAFVFSFDKWVTHQDFVDITMHTVRDNLKTGFVWDNDPFATNHFMHPYHGNLYFNAARSSGMNFWQSVPYAVGGSLMWELFAECEPPAINDWMATSLAGSGIGEVLNRVSHLFLDNRTRGSRRFWREAGAFVVNPMQGLNRLLHGNAWRVSNERHEYADNWAVPIDASVSVGDRYLADDGELFKGEHNPYVNFKLEYGDALSTAHNAPYDYFSADITFGLSSNQPLLNNAHLLGRLWGTELQAGSGADMVFGLYQHYNFYDSQPVKDGTSTTPYRLTETVSVGPGAVLRLPQVGALERLQQSIYVSGILLGGSKTDYYNVIDRDYNMGSGYSLKTQTQLAFRRLGCFNLQAKYYHLYTWKGYEHKDLATVNPLKLNAQGDKSNAQLLVLAPTMEFYLSDGLSLEVQGAYFMRHTNYKYHANQRLNTFEWRGGLTWYL